MSKKDIFKRKEYKYIINEIMFKNILSSIKKYLHIDEYGKETIYSIYYDTKNYDLIRHSIEKPIFKEKFRTRSYGKTDNHNLLFAEIKKKFDGITYKRRVGSDEKDLLSFLNDKKELSGNLSFYGEELCNKQIQKEILFFLDFYKLEKKVFIAYERESFIDDNNNLRITFDNNIRFRENDLNHNSTSYGKLLTNKDIYIMEIKLENAFPFWLINILNENKLFPVSFSKYGEYYKNIILKNTRIFEGVENV
ncbi:MAG: polyphosphate polymerase domain-containing protein [Eubacteriales bacterium]|nr:polyphosphate polymerase domain-containing protein [Eubacteriales bacterium]